MMRVWLEVPYSVRTGTLFCKKSYSAPCLFLELSSSGVPPFSRWDSFLCSLGFLHFAGIPPLQRLCLPALRLLHLPAFCLPALRLLGFSAFRLPSLHLPLQLFRLLRLSVFRLVPRTNSAETPLSHGTPTPSRASPACGFSSPEDSSHLVLRCPETVVEARKGQLFGLHLGRQSILTVDKDCNWKTQKNTRPNYPLFSDPFS